MYWLAYLSRFLWHTFSRAEDQGNSWVNSFGRKYESSLVRQSLFHSFSVPAIKYKVSFGSQAMGGIKSIPFVLEVCATNPNHLPWEQRKCKQIKLSQGLVPGGWGGPGRGEHILSCDKGALC